MSNSPLDQDLPPKPGPSFTMKLIRGADGSQSVLFTHSDGFRCLRIYDADEVEMNMPIDANSPARF